jgi:hypothetical protein
MEYFVPESEFDCDCETCQNGGCKCNYCASKDTSTKKEK